MVFLVVVTDSDIGAKGESSGIRRNDFIQDFQKCRLSGTIVPDNRNVLSTFDFKADVFKERLIRESFAEVINTEHIISADNRRLQL